MSWRGARGWARRGGQGRSEVEEGPGVAGRRGAAGAGPTKALLLAACWAGCVAVEAGGRDAAAVAEALAGVVRLHYAARLALEEGPVAQAAPEAEELRAARARLDGALGGAGGGEDDGRVARARAALVAEGWVVLPAAPGLEGTDPGLPLARVVERAQGLSRTFGEGGDARVVRYRRVVHEDPALPDYPAWRDLRRGEAGWWPVGRSAGPTVYVDRDAAARRARRAPWAGASAEDLQAVAEVQEAAAILARREAEPGGDAATDAETRVALAARALAWALGHLAGEAGPGAATRLAVARRELTWLASGPPEAPPELAQAARRVAQSAGAGDLDAPAWGERAPR